MCLNDAYCSGGTVVAYNTTLANCQTLCQSQYSTNVFSYSAGYECACVTNNCSTIRTRSNPPIAIYADAEGVCFYVSLYA